MQHPLDHYRLDTFRQEFAPLLQTLAGSPSVAETRDRLFHWVNACQRTAAGLASSRFTREITILRDCARAMRSLLSERSEALSRCSLAGELHAIATGAGDPGWQPAFFAEVTHLLAGVGQDFEAESFEMRDHGGRLTGREAAIARSDDLDELWERVESRIRRYQDGLDPRAQERRRARRDRLQARWSATDAEWGDWRWQVAHLITTPAEVAATTRLSASELAGVEAARHENLPFGATPYYLSLLDDDPTLGHDRALRAQILPPPEMVAAMAADGHPRGQALDYMREADTSPIDLITRRYPAICILKPFNTCPQICTYCQRNWEIEQAMAPDALAPADRLDAAIAWIAAHPAIREVLITGGDPLAMTDEQLASLLERLAEIDSIDLIRIGSRTPVTLPMRITPELAALLGRHRLPGRRDVALVTHVEHVYEITPDLVAAIDRLRREGIAVYNQHVYTFFVSRRFEAVALRLLLRRVGIDPYYTFVPKGKEETSAFRVPLARLLQELKEEARLLPGSRRTDEAVYNLPALGKNHIRALQHRDLVGLTRAGERVYEFHPWEKNILERGSYVGTDVPILEYLQRLAASGEDPKDYSGIWYYF